MFEGYNSYIYIFCLRSTFYSIRVEQMERQLASLTGLVQKALSTPSGKTSPSLSISPRPDSSPINMGSDTEGDQVSNASTSKNTSTGTPVASNTGATETVTDTTGTNTSSGKSENSEPPSSPRQSTAKSNLTVPSQSSRSSGRQMNHKYKCNKITQS